jgi:hypothetical protein
MHDIKKEYKTTSQFLIYLCFLRLLAQVSLKHSLLENNIQLLKLLDHHGISYHDVDCND